MKHLRQFKPQLRYLALAATLVAVAGCETVTNTIPEAVQQQTSVTQDFSTYSAETFYQTTSFGIAGTTAISPDNRWLLISSDETGVFNVYRINLQSGQREQLTHSSSDASFAIGYFPDGQRFLYTADQGGNELNHVFVAEPGGDVRDLTPGENLKAGFAGWADDYSAFYLTSNERDSKAFDLYRYDANSYARELVFQNDDALAVAAVSGDGRWLALLKSETSANADVYLLDLSDSDATPQLITEHTGDIAYGVYDFTPEDDALVISTNEFGEYAQAWLHDLDSGERQLLVSDDWDVSYISYSPDGQYQISGVNDDGSTRIAIVNRQTGEPLALPKLPAGDPGSIRFSQDGSKMAFVLNGPRSPSNIFTLDMGSNAAPKQLTQALHESINPEHLVDSTVIRYPSFDGLEIPSIQYKPKQASASNKVPALVWVHGGPGGQSRTGYNAAIQHLVNQGYAVLAANNRGSSGYGKTFFHMDDKKHGEVDLQDIVYAKQYLQSLDWVDGDRIGIIGGSYGGYMVAAALAFEPEVFDVGINIFGVTNWVRTLESIPPWWESFKKSLYDEMGDPATDAERHHRISPLFHASNIVKPLLVVQGANDPRVLQVESDELVEAVRANNTPVEYVIFPDEGHGFRKRENRITASNAYLEFLNTYLR